MRKHTTVSGDAFDLLARIYYGDEMLSSKIIQANPDYCDTLIFEAGTVLNIPDYTEIEKPETLPPWRR